VGTPLATSDRKTQHAFAFLRDEWGRESGNRAAKSRHPILRFVAYRGGDRKKGHEVAFWSVHAPVAER
jgi:hypothetical protein